MRSRKKEMNSNDTSIIEDKKGLDSDEVIIPEKFLYKPFLLNWLQRNLHLGQSRRITTITKTDLQKRITNILGIPIQIPFNKLIGLKVYLKE
jgi:hypothetical protein